MVCHNSALVTAWCEYPTRLYSLDFEETPEAIAPGSNEWRSQQESYWCNFIQSLCHFIKLQKLDEIANEGEELDNTKHFDNQECDQNSCASLIAFDHIERMRSLWTAYIPCTKGNRGKKKKKPSCNGRKEEKSAIQTSLEKFIKKAPGINICIYS